MDQGTAAKVRSQLYRAITRAQMVVVEDSEWGRPRGGGGLKQLGGGGTGGSGDAVLATGSVDSALEL
jgi:hypothetical protein